MCVSEQETKRERRGRGRSVLGEDDFEFEEYVDLWSHGYEKNFIFNLCTK